VQYGGRIDGNDEFDHRSAIVEVGSQVSQDSEQFMSGAPEVSRLSLFGDLPTRGLLWLLKSTPRMPYFLEAIILAFFTTIVFLLARQQRNAIRRNLKAIWPESSLAEQYVGVFRVFANFGWTYADGIRTRLGQKVITWEIEGAEIFEEIRNKTDAAIILTTHTGNYDLAAALFSPKFGRNLHTVRAPERSPLLQEIRRKELQADVERYEHFKVHYNSSQSLLGIELARLLAAGELLAIQSDRVIAEVAGIDVPLPKRDVSIRLPKGPMILAAISKCPCYPLHVVRVRYRHYRIVFYPRLQVTGKNGGNPKEQDYARAWAASLLPFLEEHAHQWFVFEDAFTP
jgi:lauroyl/myristoyl acyltransferase